MGTTDDDVEPATFGDRIEQGRLERAAAERGVAVDEVVALEAVETSERRRRAATAWAESDDLGRLAGASMDNLAPSVIDHVHKWLAVARRGANLVLVGNPGVGKSYAAVAAARAWLEAFPAGRSNAPPGIMFTDVAMWLERQRPGHGRGEAGGWLELGQEARLLVLDDVGLERPTEWSAERLDLLVHHRWMHRRPTIVTTNVTLDELPATLGPRATSRLAGDSVAVEVIGPDRRFQ